MQTDTNTVDDEAKIRVLKRVAIAQGVIIACIFVAAGVFAYYNFMTERPAKELFFPRPTDEQALPPG